MRLRNIILFFIFLAINIQARSQALDTLYWIGNGGAWEDASHWSYSSGGPPNNGFEFPSINHTAIFDDQSFTMANQQVVSSVNMFVYDMDWSAVTNNPEYVIAANQFIDINGS